MSALQPVDLDVYRKALKSRKRTVSLASSRLKQARKTARRAGTILKKQFGVKKVVLFGSVLHPALFHSRSDIDIAAWGLKGREYFRAVGLLQALDPEIAIDLIAFEDAPPSLKKIIRTEGKALNVYAFNLRSARLDELIADLPDCFQAVQSDLLSFAKFLESI